MCAINKHLQKSVDSFWISVLFAFANYINTRRLHQPIQTDMHILHHLQKKTIKHLHNFQYRWIESDYYDESTGNTRWRENGISLKPWNNKISISLVAFVIGVFLRYKDYKSFDSIFVVSIIYRFIRIWIFSYGKQWRKSRRKINEYISTLKRRCWTNAMISLI